MNVDTWTGTLLDNISAGICIIDRNLKVQFWNEYMEEYTGYSRDEMLNNFLFDVFPKFNESIYRERIDNIFNGWPPVILSSRLHEPFFNSRIPSKSIRYQEITITPQSGKSDEIDQAVFTITDVTDLTIKLEEQKSLYINAQNEIKIRTEVQEKLSVSENRLRELNSTKDKFFSIIAHDLMSPFNSILGLCEVLSENIAQQDFESIKDYNDSIIASTKRAFALLVNLLDWAKLQTGHIAFEPIKVGFSKIVSENIDLCKSQAENKKLKIVSEVEPNLFVYIDYNMINTVVRNLLSNAIKYTDENGKITLKANSDSEGLCFSIMDTGVGIKNENLEKMFRLDFQISTPGTASETGSGLGLILCKEFIEKHNGKIWVESEFGKGSTFKFVIPNGIEK